LVFLIHSEMDISIRGSVSGTGMSCHQRLFLNMEKNFLNS